MRRALIACLWLAACAAPPASTPEPSPTPMTPLDPPRQEDGFQLDEGTFRVQPHAETLYCMRLPIPARYGSEPVFVRGIESRLPDATHHFFMAYHDEPLEEPTPCGNEEPGENHVGEGKIVFLSGVGDYGYFLPDGYGLYLDSGAGQFTTSHHALNFTESALDMYGLFNVYTDDAASVHHPVNVLNCLLRDLWVAPFAQTSVSATCTVPFDLDMVILSSHAHQYLERFEMRIFDGSTTLPDPIYTSTTWDSPNVVTLAQPISLKQGQGLTFTCDYNNPTNEWIVFGAGEFEEMCAIMSNYAYPADRPHDVPVSLGGIVFTEGASVELVDTTDLGGQF